MFWPSHIVWQRLRRQTKDTVHNTSMVHVDIYMYYLCKDILHNIIYIYVCLSHGCTALLWYTVLASKSETGFAHCKSWLWDLIQSDWSIVMSSWWDNIYINNVLCEIHFLAEGPNFISDLNSEWVTSLSIWLWGQYLQMLYIDIGLEVLVHCGSLMIQTFWNPMANLVT